MESSLAWVEGTSAGCTPGLGGKGSLLAAVTGQTPQGNAGNGQCGVQGLGTWGWVSLLGLHMP